MTEEQSAGNLSKRAQRRAAEEEAVNEAAPETTGTQAGSEETEAQNRRERRAAAAQRRAERNRERTKAAAVGLDAGEIVDDALARASDKSAKWLQRNFSTLQWVLVGGVAIWVGYQVYAWRTLKAESAVGDELAKASAALLAPIGEEEASGQLPGTFEDPTPKFETAESAREAALAAFKEVSSKRPDAPTAVWATLGQAGVALDLGQHDEALALFQEVKADPTAATTPELKGRALEGIALVHEAKGDSEAALKAYRELENAEISGFREVAWLSQARLLEAKGEREPAKELLAKLRESIDKSDAKRSPYLEPALTQLQQVIDPEAAEASKKADQLKDMSSDDLKKMLEQIQQKQGSGSPAPAPAAP